MFHVTSHLCYIPFKFHNFSFFLHSNIFPFSWKWKYILLHLTSYFMSLLFPLHISILSVSCYRYFLFVVHYIYFTLHHILRCMTLYFLSILIYFNITGMVCRGGHVAPSLFSPYETSQVRTSLNTALWCTFLLSYYRHSLLFCSFL